MSRRILTFAFSTDFVLFCLDDFCVETIYPVAINSGGGGTFFSRSILIVVVSPGGCFGRVCYDMVHDKLLFRTGWARGGFEGGGGGGILTVMHGGT